jgi:serine/threonine-protein kinase
MHNHSWTQVDELFAAALDVEPTSRRAFLLARSQGDATLVDRVLHLLDSLSTAERVIGESADVLVSAPQLEPMADDLLASGTRVGPYEIRDEIGRGGMGAVYRGVRADASFERQVAIKVVNRAVASQLMLRRFAAEQRILATLEHPNIARLYDSGLTTDGRPYLVMEYIEGSRIDRFADERSFGLRERVALIESVCDAVAFAHRHLIVHRDLKPANILVTTEGRAVLLDFGIAKLLAADDTGDSTRAGQRFLTPEYASPEHLRDGPATAAMDVYSLGVMLYELLTGARPPWQTRVIERAPLDELERAVVPPSVTITRPQGQDAAPARAAQARALKGDIDTIVVTALAPDPTRRYASVDALHEDLRRLRTGFPIVARPATLRLRFTKFVRRNRALASVASLTVLLAAGYLGTLVVQSRRITAERDRAERQRNRADQVATLLVEMFGATNPFNPGRPDTLRVSDFLAAGAARFDSDLAGQPMVHGALLTALARAQRGLGRSDRARELLARAEGLLRDSAAAAPLPLAETLDEQGQLAHVDIKRDEAERLYREAVSLFERAPDARPAQVAMSYVHLASVLADKGTFDSAGAYLGRADSVRALLPAPDSALATAILTVRGTLHYRRGEPERGVELAREALALNRARLGALHPQVLLEQANLAFSLTTIGQTKEAIPLYRASIEGLRARLTLAHPTVVEQLRTLSASLSRDSQPVAAESTMRVALDGARQLGATSTALAETLDAFGQLMERWGQPQKSAPAYAEALAINRRNYGESHPVTAIVRARMANLGCITPGPSAARRAALAELSAALVTIDREFQPPEPVRLKIHSDLGMCLAALGERDQARRVLQANFDAGLAGRGASHPMVQNVGRWLAKFYESVGDSAAATRTHDALGVGSR